jgi:hypothetical protein
LLFITLLVYSNNPLISINDSPEVIMLLLRFALCAFAVMGLSFAGCSKKGDGRVEVTGSVKLKGTPIKEGTISFEPLEGQATGATAMINDGSYNVPRESGLLPGKYLIRVSAGDGKTPVNLVDPDHPPGPTGSTNIVSKDLIPADWNVDSKQERTVSKDSPNRIEFEIP